MDWEGKGANEQISFQPFFNGKLILQDATASSGRSASNAVTSTLFATHAAAIMPSPAEQVTDDLVSPKYDDDDEDEDATEEDESDDTVYECPGLAAPGQEMCVSNPFFLRGRDLPHLREARASDRDHHQQQQQPRRQPQPISQHSNILFHHGIKGVN